MRHKGQHQDVRHRQPRRAQLVIAGRLRIYDPARDVQVRFGVAIVEQPAVRVEERNGNRGGQRQKPSGGQRALPCSRFQNWVQD